jgi:hypothetical protein
VGGGSGGGGGGGGDGGGAGVDCPAGALPKSPSWAMWNTTSASASSVSTFAWPGNAAKSGKPVASPRWPLTLMSSVARAGRFRKERSRVKSRRGSLQVCARPRRRHGREDVRRPVKRWGPASLDSARQQPVNPIQQDGQRGRGSAQARDVRRPNGLWEATMNWFDIANRQYLTAFERCSPELEHWCTWMPRRSICPAKPHGSGSVGRRCESARRNLFTRRVTGA